MNNRHRFCEEHVGLKDICVVEDCGQRVVKGRKTCSKPQHRKWEKGYQEKQKAFFQLKERLARAGVSQPLSSIQIDHDLDEDVVDLEFTETDPSHKSDSGNRKIKVRLIRRRTHNEQLVVCCCGIIAARATMFGAEAISGVKVIYC